MTKRQWLGAAMAAGAMVSVGFSSVAGASIPARAVSHHVGVVRQTPTAMQPRTCTWKIASFAFSPSKVVEGEATTLTVKVTNCTKTQRSVDLVRTGTVPTGCTAIASSTKELTIAGGATYTSSDQIIAPQCKGTETRKARLTTLKGASITSSTASLSISQPASG